MNCWTFPISLPTSISLHLFGKNHIGIVSAKFIRSPLKISIGLGEPCGCFLQFEGRTSDDVALFLRSALQKGDEMSSLTTEVILLTVIVLLFTHQLNAVAPDDNGCIC